MTCTVSFAFSDRICCIVFLHQTTILRWPKPHLVGSDGLCFWVLHKMFFFVSLAFHTFVPHKQMLCNSHQYFSHHLVASMFNDYTVLILVTPSHQKSFPFSVWVVFLTSLLFYHLNLSYHLRAHSSSVPHCWSCQLWSVLVWLRHRNRTRDSRPVSYPYSQVCSWIRLLFPYRVSTLFRSFFGPHPLFNSTLYYHVPPFNVDSIICFLSR